MPGQDIFYHFGRRLKAFCQLPAVGVGMLKRVCGCKVLCDSRRVGEFIKKQNGEKSSAAVVAWYGVFFFPTADRITDFRDHDG